MGTVVKSAPDDQQEASQKLNPKIIENIPKLRELLFPEPNADQEVNNDQEVNDLVKNLQENLYSIQMDVLERMLGHIEGHIKNKQDPNMLLDIATGFGKTRIQIAFAGILEYSKSNYKIVVPNRLVNQAKGEVYKMFTDPLAERIRSNIVGHKEFLLKDWESTKALDEKTIVMIDEVDEGTKQFLPRERVRALLKKHVCINLSATLEEWLYNYIQGIGGGIIPISLKEKVEKMGIILPHLQNVIAESVMGKTNRTSKFLPYACVAIASYTLILLIKIYSNSYVLEWFKNLLTAASMYNVYLSVFVLNPLVGILAWGIVYVGVVMPINWLINKIADKNISGRLWANLKESKVVSPAHSEVYASEETFVCHDYNGNKLVQSPIGEKTLILACNDDVLRNLSNIYRSEGEIYKNGKLFNPRKIHDEHKLGRDFDAVYDSSFREVQRILRIAKYKEAVTTREVYRIPGIKRYKEAITTSKKENNIDRVDFSDTATYAEYRVMHGIINSALLALLQDFYIEGKDGEKKYEDVLVLNKARMEKPEELLQDVLHVLKGLSLDGTNALVKSYLEAKGFKGNLLSEMSGQMAQVIHVLQNSKEEDQKLIVDNWVLSKDLHNMMKIGDEYQILDDIRREFDEIKKIAKSLTGQDFDKKCKYDLGEYLKDKFGLESSEFINEMYSALKSANYRALASIFRNNNLFETINSNESKFPLCQLRELCKKNKIVFNVEGKRPFYSFDKNGDPEIYRSGEIAKGLTEENIIKLQSEEVTKLFVEGWIGVLVDPSKTTGFSDPSLNSVVIIIGSKNDKIVAPDQMQQSYGRCRGLDPTRQGFVRVVKQKGVKLCFDLVRLMKGNSIKALFDARKKHNKQLLKEIGNEISAKLASYISTRRINDSDLHEFCIDLLASELEELYNRNNHDLKKTRDEFIPISESVKEFCITYEKRISNQGKPGMLYRTSDYILRTFGKAFYCLWTALDYTLFYLRTIGKDKIENGIASKEATYIHIIKNYSIVTFFSKSIIEHKKVIEALLRLSKKDELFVEFLTDKGGICKKALNKIISPLEPAHIETLLKCIYPNDSDKDIKNKRKKILLFIERLNCKWDKNYTVQDREIVEYILEISKEIVASHRWHHNLTNRWDHNLTNRVEAEGPKLKSSNSKSDLKSDSKSPAFAFCIGNVSHAGAFLYGIYKDIRNSTINCNSLDLI